MLSRANGHHVARRGHLSGRLYARVLAGLDVKERQGLALSFGERLELKHTKSPLAALTVQHERLRLLEAAGSLDDQVR